MDKKLAEQLQDGDFILYKKEQRTIICGLAGAWRRVQNIKFGPSRTIEIHFSDDFNALLDGWADNTYFENFFIRNGIRITLDK